MTTEILNLASENLKSTLQAQREAAQGLLEIATKMAVEEWGKVAALREQQATDGEIDKVLDNAIDLNKRIRDLGSLVYDLNIFLGRFMKPAGY